MPAAPPSLTLRDAGERDFDAIVALNAAEVARTSPMDRARLAGLHTLAWHHRVACVDGTVRAFVLAMDHGAAYDNDNLRWFRARLPAFAYVDRIVVDAALAGRGVGARLYRALCEAARARGIAHLACEYDLDPPNPASRAFHARFGFVEAGQRRTDAGKLVSMQVLDLDAARETRRA